MYDQKLLECSIPNAKFTVAESSRYKRKTDGVWETVFQVFAISDKNALFLECFTNEKKHMFVWESIKTALGAQDIDKANNELKFSIENLNVRHFNWFPIDNTQTIKIPDYGHIELTYELSSGGTKTVLLQTVEQSEEFLGRVKEQIKTYIIRNAEPVSIPMSRSDAVQGPGCCLGITLLFTFFLLFAGVSQVSAGRSGVVRGIATAITQMVTPLGVIIISGTIILICVVMITRRLHTPPNEDKYFLNGATAPVIPSPENE